MTIPDYQALMLPLLELASDGAEHSSAEATETLSSKFALTPEERETILPSGRQTTIANRVGWAKTYLAKAGLLDGSKRGTVRITDRGRAVLKSSPTKIDIAFLSQFPEFEEFRKRTKPADSTDVHPGTVGVSEQTPREVLESSFQELRRTLAEELLDRVKSNSPDFFQRLVVSLLIKMGYGASLADAGSVVGGSGDRGIDGIVKQDVLGLDAVYIQAKRYGDAPIGSEIVRNFGGSLLQHKAAKGVLITTSRFSEEAKIAAAQMDKRIVLVDGAKLSELMIDYGVGVIEDRTFVVKRMDSDFFEEELS